MNKRKARARFEAHLKSVKEIRMALLRAKVDRLEQSLRCCRFSA